MSKEIIYRKHLVKDGLPKFRGEYPTDLGNIYYYPEDREWSSIDEPIWWLEHTDLNVFTDEELRFHSFGWHLFITKEDVMLRAFNNGSTLDELYEEYLKQLLQ